MRKSSLMLAIVGVIILSVIPESAFACPNCYGAIADTEIAKGLQLAMLALIASISVIGVGVGMFFSNISKRAVQHAAGELNTDSDS